jgi:hypothetical protein
MVVVIKSEQTGSCAAPSFISQDRRTIVGGKSPATWQSQQAKETGLIGPDQIEVLDVLGQEGHRL